MPHRIVAALPSARLQPYRDLWTANGGTACTDADIAPLYQWQVEMCSAWYEVLAYTETVVRHALDNALRQWNTAQGLGPDWIAAPAPTLRRVLGARVMTELHDSASRAAAKRGTADRSFGPHPRQGQPVSHDDLVAQLTFGNLVHLLPITAPTPQARGRLRSNLTRSEQLWIHGTQHAFPHLPNVSRSRHWTRFSPGSSVPSSVAQGYLLSSALERLRGVRNRVGHHEQMFRVGHVQRHRDAILVVRAISDPAAVALQALSRVLSSVAAEPKP
ncbi:hypothetical protein BTO20_37785 (plasmid) [Mycobacterium dioxanotrophicus]|jgi:hypothetical protein|uniref:CAAX protease n=1 Tax=Mycobacterium dioxanotrophicus TaxID=482462 RepID=A0A1Y0CGG4_9MYCO|nr:hypothetical protein BTO20_37785 [Mycobacterium dioxanotrophicus]